MNHIAAPSVAFIFDCDGTLVNSSPVWGHAQTELLHRHGIDVTVDDFAQFEHLSLEDECQAYHDGRGGALQAVPRCVRTGAASPGRARRA